MCPGACDEKTADIPSNFVAAISILNVEGDVIHLAMGGWIGRPGKRPFFLSQVSIPQTKVFVGFVVASGGGVWQTTACIVVYIFLYW